MRVIDLKEAVDVKKTNVPASSYPEYNSSTNYSKGDKVKVQDAECLLTFEYESIIDNNVKNNPPEHPEAWLPLGASNRCKMFDQYVNTETENQGNIAVEVDSSNSDAVALFNVQAKKITFTQVVAGELFPSSGVTLGTGWSSSGEEYSCDGTQDAESKLSASLPTSFGPWVEVTFSVNVTSGSLTAFSGGASGEFVSASGGYSQVLAYTGGDDVGLVASPDFVGTASISAKRVPKYESISLETLLKAGWWEYYFTEREFLTTALWTYPRYRNSTLKVDIVYFETGAAKCGNFVLGSQSEIGDTALTPSFGLLDYSKKDTDDFGRTYLKQGSYAREADVDVWISNGELDSIERLFARLRGRAAVFDLNNSGKKIYESAIIYGFYSEFSATVSGPTVSLCSLDIKGLI